MARFFFLHHLHCPRTAATTRNGSARMPPTPIDPILGGWCFKPSGRRQPGTAASSNRAAKVSYRSPRRAPEYTPVATGCAWTFSATARRTPRPPAAAWKSALAQSAGMSTPASVVVATTGCVGAGATSEAANRLENTKADILILLYCQHVRRDCTRSLAVYATFSAWRDFAPCTIVLLT